jgi:hypothetical protein
MKTAKPLSMLPPATKTPKLLIYCAGISLDQRELLFEPMKKII